MPEELSKEEMISCLKKSGYLLEGRIVNSLNSMGLFVEPGQSFLDDKTGVSREIDLIAETYSYTPDRPQVCVKTYFIIEAINNLYPVVLLTPRAWTPNAPFEEYLHFKATPSELIEGHPFLGDIDLHEVKNVGQWNIYAQYCAFTRKKSNDLMASHPEDLHASINKAASYLFYLKDESHSWMDENDTDKYWRLFQWQVILVLQNDLYLVREDVAGSPELIETTAAKLEYNFHYKGQPKTVVVDFVVESALPNLIQKVCRQDDNIEKQIYKLKNNPS